MDTPPPVPPPVPPPPAATPQPGHVPPKPSGCGCFASGCMGLLLLGFVGLLALVLGGWFLYAGFVKKLTTEQPSEITMTMPSEAEFQAADAKLTELKTALRSQQETTITLSATDLNALLARHPDFHAGKNRVRVAIADSLATVEVSVPLKNLSWPGFRNRWFNGRAQLAFSYDDNGFNLNPQSLEANGHELSGAFVRAFGPSFDHSFTVGFEEQIKEDDADSLWLRVKSIALEGDHLTITTYGPPGT